MNFLNPIFLISAAAILIPLFIYLWNRRKKTILKISSLFLFQKMESTSIRSLQISNWLLLFIRILAILFLVMGLAQPILAPNVTKINYDLIVIDRSPSFFADYPDGMKDSILSVTDEYLSFIQRQNPTIQILTTDSLDGFNYVPGKSVADHSLYHTFPVQKIKALQKPDMRAAILTTMPSPILNPLNQLYVDTMQIKWDILAQSSKSLSNNIGFMSLSYPDQIWKVGTPNRILLKVANDYPDSIRKNVSISINRILRQTLSIGFPAGQSDLFLPVLFESTGPQSVKISLEDSGFELDNHWHFSASIPSETPIYLQTRLSSFNAVIRSLVRSYSVSGSQTRLIETPSEINSGTLLLVTTQLSTILPALPLSGGLIYIPDFSRPEDILSDLSLIGIAAKQVKDQVVFIGQTTDHSFWSYLGDNKLISDAGITSEGLVTIASQQPGDILAWSMDNQPLLLSVQMSGIPLLIFLTNPFSVPDPDVLALSMLIHSITWLNSQSDRLYGPNSFIINHSEWLTIPNNDENAQLLSPSGSVIRISPGLDGIVLTPRELTQPGHFTLKSTETEWPIGVSYPYHKPGTGNFQDQDGVSIVEISNWNDLIAGEGDIPLSVPLILISLLLFLLESILSRKNIGKLSN